MAREFASTRLSIWGDPAFRALTPPCQHLYFVLSTSPALSFCGVTDWRPNRIAALSGGWSASAVELAGKELAARGFVVIDEETEEVLIRSFVRDDGLMKQPNMAVAMCTAQMAVASGRIREVISEEVRLLSLDQPELACWGAKSSKDLLASMIQQAIATPVKAVGNPSGNPSRKGLSKGSQEAIEGFPSGQSNPSANPSPTTATAPATAPSSSTSPTETAANAAGAAETEGQLVNRLARVYTDRVSMSKFLAVSGVVKTAVRAKRGVVRQYSDQEITNGLLTLVEEGRTVTVDSLRIAMEGLPPLPSRRASRAGPLTDKGNPEFVPPPPTDPFATKPEEVRA